MTLLVRDQKPADAGAVRQLLATAFGRPAVAELSEQLAALDGPGARLVAELDDTVVGQVQLSRGWLDAPEQLFDVLVLSPLGVTPPHQGHGIGTLLVQAAMERARHLSAPLLFLEGSPLYYARFGFLGAGRKGFTAPSVRIPPAAFQVYVLPGWQPAMTGALVYPDVFWRLDSVGRR